MTKISLDWPVWYHPSAPLGSAVRYIASLSPKYNWVGIYTLNQKTLKLGPFLGKESPHRLIRVGQGVCGTAVKEKRNLNVPDVSQQSNYLSCNRETRSELVVLILDRKKRILGQIDIDSHTLNAFSADDENRIQRIADELGALWPKRKN